MRIEWDEHKRLTNLEKHGFDFKDLTWDWLGALEPGPARGNRFIVTGVLNGQVIAVIFAQLGTEAVAVISMHRVRSKGMIQ